MAPVSDRWCNVPHKPELKLVKSATTPRSASGRFVKGAPKPPNAGRTKGKRNRTTGLLRDAIIKAADLCGRDGRGTDGAVGYLVWLSRAEPAVFGRLLERVLPMQVEVADKTARTLTASEAVQRLRERQLPVPTALLALAQGSSSVPVDNIADDYRDELSGLGLPAEGEDVDDTE